MQTGLPTNEEIADVLDRVAGLLEAQGANPYRVRAYRRAARTIQVYDGSIAEIAASEDTKGLEDLPDIGKSIAGAIREFVTTWRLGMLERLEGQVSPEDLFTTVPGIGEKLAHRIHNRLNIETLEGLELAAHDGRLEQVPGMGERRIKSIRDVLSTMLSRSSRRRARRIRFLADRHGDHGEQPTLARPSVDSILGVDRDYRQKAAAGALRTIAPRRFNPQNQSWLPVLHVERDGWHFTAMFSNTARAHQLGKTRDWVVIYYERDGHENQHTVVTEHHGPLAGKRVIRGLDHESRAHYTKNRETGNHPGRDNSHDTING